MTTELTTGAPSRALTSWMAWTVPPDEDGDQVTHAVGSGTTVALCGAATTCQGAPWPTTTASWTFALSRCEACATAVDGG